MEGEEGEGEWKEKKGKEKKGKEKKGKEKKGCAKDCTGGFTLYSWHSQHRGLTTNTNSVHERAGSNVIGCNTRVLCVNLPPTLRFISSVHFHLFAKFISLSSTRIINSTTHTSARPAQEGGRAASTADIIL